MYKHNKENRAYFSLSKVHVRMYAHTEISVLM